MHRQAKNNALSVKDGFLAKRSLFKRNLFYPLKVLEFMSKFQARQCNPEKATVGLSHKGVLAAHLFVLRGARQEINAHHPFSDNLCMGSGLARGGSASPQLDL